MWININGEQYVRLEDVVEAITNALDALSPKQKAKPEKETKQVEGQLELPMAIKVAEPKSEIVPAIGLSRIQVLNAVDSVPLLHDLLYNAYQKDYEGGPNIYALIDEKRNSLKLVAPQYVIDKILTDYRESFRCCVQRAFSVKNVWAQATGTQAALINEPVTPGPLDCEAADFVPRNGRKLPYKEYLEERERVYDIIVKLLGVGVFPTRSEVAEAAGTNYDVARIHIRALMAAGRINKDDISSRVGK